MCFFFFDQKVDDSWCSPLFIPGYCCWSVNLLIINIRLLIAKDNKVQRASHFLRKWEAAAVKRFFCWVSEYFSLKLLEHEAMKLETMSFSFSSSRLWHSNDLNAVKSLFMACLCANATFIRAAVHCRPLKKNFNRHFSCQNIEDVSSEVGRFYELSFWVHFMSEDITAVICSGFWTVTAVLGSAVRYYRFVDAQARSLSCGSCQFLPSLCFLVASSFFAGDKHEPC